MAGRRPVCINQTPNPPESGGSKAQEFPTTPIRQARGPALSNPRATGEGAWIALILIGPVFTTLNLALLVIYGNTGLHDRLKCKQMLNIMFRIDHSLAPGNYVLNACGWMEQMVVQRKINSTGYKHSLYANYFILRFYVPISEKNAMFCSCLAPSLKIAFCKKL